MSEQEKSKYLDETDSRKLFGSASSSSSSITRASTKKLIYFKISRPIVDVIINQLLQDYDPEDDEISNAVSHSVDDLFKLVVENGEEHYEASVSNKIQYELIVSYVSIGVSFRQCSRLLLSCKELANLSEVGNCNVAKVIQAVRFTCCQNYEVLCKILQHAWAFSIAMDAGTKASVPYLDVRVRATVDGSLYNLHLVALPMTESHTGENTFLLIEKFLDALCSNWRKKLISVSTDGASNMQGRYQGAVTRLDDVCCDGFYRIWCGAHQLDLVIQSIFVQMLNNTFVETTQRITGHLRRQQNLIRTMETKCPKFVDTRWLSMGRLLKWLVKNRVQVSEYMESRDSPCKPDLT